MNTRWRTPILATLTCYALIVVGGAAATLLPARFQGNWRGQIARDQAHFLDRFFPFDALWYEQIAADGYRWDPAQPALKQDVAFFPLWPLVLRAVSGARWAAVALAALFGFGSVCAFAALARRVLAGPEAAWATWLFALYPGASFLLLGYPTGLMNLLVILALLAVLDRRFWLGALWAGIGTASGPLGLGTALAVWGCAARAEGGVLTRRPLAPAMVRLGGLGLLSMSGLCGFLLWQAVTFGDPLAFVKAQAAWATPVGWLTRASRAFGQVAIVPDFGWGLAYVAHALHARTLVGLQAGLETGVHHMALGLALLMLVVCARRVPLPVLLQGIFTLALFVVFHSAVRPGNSAVRLTYCALTTFLGLGVVLRHFPGFRGLLYFVFGMMLFSAAFLSAAGYHVV